MDEESEAWSALASGVTPGDLAGLGLGTALGLREGDPLADIEGKPEGDQEGDGMALLDAAAPDAPPPAYALPEPQSRLRQYCKVGWQAHTSALLTSDRSSMQPGANLEYQLAEQLAEDPAVCLEPRVALH